MKRVVIVHCWGGYPNYCWYPKVKKDLEEAGFEVFVPEMPETDIPKLSSWLPKLKESAPDPNEELYLVGHSAGCITIMRYLEELPEDKKVGGVVFVAGFTDDLGYPELKNFFEDPINFEKISKAFLRIKSSAESFVAINSDNDPHVDLKYGEILKEKLGAKLIIKHNFGHFSGPLDDPNSCTELPDVTEAIKEMTNNY